MLCALRKQGHDQAGQFSGMLGGLQLVIHKIRSVENASQALTNVWKSTEQSLNHFMRSASWRMSPGVNRSK